MFCSDVPQFAIDLARPPAERWSHVVEAMREPASALVSQAGHELARVPSILRGAFGWYYWLRGGLYTREITALAKALGVSRGTATVLNCAYEISHIQVPRILGCTAGVRYVHDRGMVHVRTLDWPLPAMGPATCIFHMRYGLRQFDVVGVPGQVGALSGMVPGGYSATINWAPPRRNPNFNFGPTFLLRHVLETCETYDEAVAALRDTPLSTSVFFTVCGVNRGEGCVIERTQTTAAVRELEEGVIVQANHHVAAPMKGATLKKGVQLENADYLDWSGGRADQMQAALIACGETGNPLLSMAQRPVENPETVQKMMFCPRTGELEVWRRLSR